MGYPPLSTPRLDRVPTSRPRLDRVPPPSKAGSGTPPRPRLDRVPPPPQMVDKVKTLPPVVLRTRAVTMPDLCCKRKPRIDLDL